MRTDIHESARGRWHGILSGLGMDRSYLTGKHGRCPICNDGRDRFRWDNRDGKGTFICSHCGSGTGVDLVMLWKGVDFREAKRLVEGQIGSAPVEAPKPDRDPARDKATMASLWRRAKPLDGLDPASRYLTARGIRALPAASAVRFSRIACHIGGVATEHPCMLAKIVAPDAKSAHLHRTLLRPDGSDKADVPTPRMMMPGHIPEGGAVRLVEQTGSTLGVAEGIETALAAMQATGVSVWATLSAGALIKWQPPAGVTRIVIFGDLDSSFTGQAAAYSLAHRLKAMWADPEKTIHYDVEVRFPGRHDDGTINDDFNDLILRGEAA